MKIYCSSCGSANSYGSQKPNFCANCGKSFNNDKNISKANSAPVPQKSPPLRAEVDYEDDDYIEEVPEIQGLDVEIESGKIQGFQFGQVAGTVDPEDVQKRPTKKGRPRKMSKKARAQRDDTFFKDFQREAGTRGRQDPSAE